MTANSKLEVITACGLSIRTAIILAGHPDNMDVDDLETYSSAYLLRLIDGTVHVVEHVEHPISGAWLSDNGTLYCVCANGTVAIKSAGQWGIETVTSSGCLSPHCIWGFPGSTTLRDVVVAVSDSELFLRKDGVWISHALPDDVEMVSSVGGWSPNSLYLATNGEGLLHWTGSNFHRIDGPKEEPRGILALSGSELLVTADNLYLLRGEADWQPLASPCGSPTIALAKCGEDAFIGGREGIMRKRGDSIDIVASGYCNILAGLGDGVLAAELQNPDSVRIVSNDRCLQVEMPCLG